VWDDACFGYTIGTVEADLSFDSRDSAPFVPKSVVIDTRDQRNIETPPPRVPWDRTIIYELHVRGFTKRRSDIAEPIRGTLAGLASRPVLEYITSLGVTSVELMPIHQFESGRHLLDNGLTNYWGYDTLGFFAVHPAYLTDPRRPERGPEEFRHVVSRFHDAGLEVILDVVYNHTVEGNELGPTISFRGLDNASYYRLNPENPRYYINDTGTGNALNARHPRVVELIADSLRYWADEMQVDGFRFDLATSLARSEAGFDGHAGLLTVCGQDPVLRRVKLIAEPWDCGPGGYQVGHFPAGWAEWNDTFRDHVRDFWRGKGSAGTLSPRLCGTAELMAHDGRQTWASVNFVAAHDGFTLRDVFSYNGKHNEANGERNADGNDNNRSTSSGVEGPSSDPAIVELRGRQMRNALATVLCAQGTPMLLAGDEFGRTQRGNNNAYCQDNELSWIDWEDAARHRELTDFVRRLIALRGRLPLLRQPQFLAGLARGGSSKDVTWLDASGHELTGDGWRDPQLCCFGMLLGAACAGGEHSQPCLLLFNGHTEPVAWTLAPDSNWSVLVDTSGEAASRPSTVTGTRVLSGRSFVLLESRSGMPATPSS
jgi:glycogen operon protein